jgi:hypothetical protein
MPELEARDADLQSQGECFQSLLIRRLISVHRQAPQDVSRCPPGSKLFATRLIEIVAVAIHQFGVLLYQLDLRLHQGSNIEEIVRWTMPRTPDDLEDWMPVPARPTIFNHSGYLNNDIYSEGVADMVGYWTEDRIFGGVVVFDRRKERDGDGGQIENPPNVYPHPGRANVTRRVTQLPDDQQQDMIEFLLADTESSASPSASASPPSIAKPSPLPILIDRQNRTRVEPEYALTQHGICRDVWERKPLNRSQMAIFDRRPQEELDYPEIMEELARVNWKAGIAPPEGLLELYPDISLPAGQRGRKAA